MTGFVLGVEMLGEFVLLGVFFFGVVLAGRFGFQLLGILTALVGVLKCVDDVVRSDRCCESIPVVFRE